MATNTASPIPTFYRIYFSTLDPIVCAWAIWMDFFTPTTVINAFVPSSIAPRNPHFDFLLQQLGGALLMLAILDVFLLRYTHDVRVWKIFEVAVLTYDLVLLYSVYDALAQQGRLSLGALRYEDWGDIVITGQAAVVRSLFILGVGLPKGGKGVKKA